jgi:hypothetical protein
VSTYYDLWGYRIAPQPHPDAFFDPMWRSMHGSPALAGWRFGYRCEAGCPDAVGDMPATSDPDSHPRECPDCGGPVVRIRAELSTGGADGR